MPSVRLPRSSRRRPLSVSLRSYTLKDIHALVDELATLWGPGPGGMDALGAVLANVVQAERTDRAATRRQVS